MIRQLIQRYKIWRYEFELKRKYPDPLIVCAHAGECCATDGDICEPLNCEACTEPVGLYGDKEGDSK